MSFKKVSFLVIIFSLFVNLAIGQKRRKGNDTVELTVTDITRIKDFEAKKAAVFGISLGMSIDQVKMKIKRTPFLSLTKDVFNERRYYINDLSSDTGKVIIGYLRWNYYDSFLHDIVLYPAATKYLHGSTCSLLSADCIDPHSEVYTRFLGEPADKSTELDIPSIGLKTVRYYYPTLYLIIEMQKKEGITSYSLILHQP